MKSCIFVIGPESSGSTLIAKIVNQVLGGEPDWNGRGFNCCNDPRCDHDNGYMEPCRPVENLVCHRSLPFRDSWPPISDWNNSYDVKYIVCTRDKNISHHSHLSRFKWKDLDVLAQEEERAIEIISDLLSNKTIPSFIWSYETYILLDKAYLSLLAEFLKIPTINFDSIEAPKNGNLRYISSPEKDSLMTRVVNKYRKIAK